MINSERLAEIKDYIQRTAYYGYDAIIIRELLAEIKRLRASIECGKCPHENECPNKVSER